MADVKLVQAGVQHLDDLIPLFDAYRVFYRKPSDLAAASDYLTDCLSHLEATVFIAYLDGVAAGFTLLYPTFSSVAMARIWILNDLFVVPERRKCGVAEALLTEAVGFAKLSGAARVSLRTEVNNETAQRVYERLGWQRNDAFYSYDFALG